MKKPKMQEWMTALLQKRFENFLICVVVNNQSKIQLRQTVLDKIKLDFLTKYPNKLVVLSEPTRDTPKSRESWANFCDRVIEISLETMEIAFGQLNQSVPQEREARNNPSWSFCNFSYCKKKSQFYMNLLAYIRMLLFNMMSWMHY